MQDLIVDWLIIVGDTVAEQFMSALSRGGVSITHPEPSILHSESIWCSIFNQVGLDNGASGADSGAVERL